MKETFDNITNGGTLSRNEAKALMSRLIAGEFSDIQIAGLLMALKSRGETPTEIAGFVDALLESAQLVNHSLECVVDCCGTGGDGSGSFNISTAAGIVAASAGVKIAKHGNRSLTSRCGSADLLETMGVRIDRTPQQAVDDLTELGICFLYAPIYHSGIRHAMPARKALGIRTVFNLLGPLLNPARVRHQLIGVFSRDIMELMAQALVELGTKHALIVHSADGLDEISISDTTFAIEVRDGQLRKFSLTPEEVGLKRLPKESIAGGEPEDNKQMFERLLQNESVPFRSAVVINAAACLYLSGLAGDIASGVSLAETALTEGKTEQLMKKWIERQL